MVLSARSPCNLCNGDLSKDNSIISQILGLKDTYFCPIRFQVSLCLPSCPNMVTSGSKKAKMVTGKCQIQSFYMSVCLQIIICYTLEAESSFLSVNTFKFSVPRHSSVPHVITVRCKTLHQNRDELVVYMRHDLGKDSESFGPWQNLTF